MTDTNWIIICISAFIFMLIIKKIAGAEHVIRSGIVSVIMGISVLFLINLTGNFTGVYLPVSRLSISVSAFLGIPGTASMLILQTFL